jgi:hypothetical protein
MILGETGLFKKLDLHKSGKDQKKIDRVKMIREKDPALYNKLANAKTKAELTKIVNKYVPKAKDDKDVDKDGLPDILELEKLRNQAYNEERKLELDAKKIEIEDRKLMQKEGDARTSANFKAKENEIKESKSNMDRISQERLKMQELRTKAQIEREKLNKKND